MKLYMYITPLLFLLLIGMFVLEVFFVAKKDSCMYITRESIKRKVFPRIKIELLEMLKYNKDDIEKMCLNIIENNIVKTKYTNDLTYNILIEDIVGYEKTKLLSIHIFNNKKELFNTVNEEKCFFITNKNDNYYISDADKIELSWDIQFMIKKSFFKLRKFFFYV